MTFIVPLLFLAAVVAAIVFGIRALAKRRTTEPSGDLDLIAYGILAIAVGVATFALVGLADAAFPEDSIVEDGAQLVATSLAGLVVAAPIAVLLWRRQTLKRREQPESPGWPIYLAVMEAVFMTALVVAAFNLLSSWIGGGNNPMWTETIIFAGVVALHEVAALRTPPGSDGAGLPRVVGSAIGLITTAIGVAATLQWIFDRIYGSLFASVSDFELGTALSFVIVGVPLWYVRWWRPWPFEPRGPRKVWAVVTSVSGLYTALGAVVAIAISVVVYVFGDPAPAGAHFDFLPIALAILIVGLAIWVLHRRYLGVERTHTLRSYEYIMAAIALGVLVGTATSLSAVAFGGFELVGQGDASLPLSIVVGIITSLAVWWWFWTQAQSAPREIEAKATPRRVYLLGMGIVAGITAAQALIASLVIVFQRLLDVGGSSSTLAIQASLFVFSGLATWHLLRVNSQDKELFEAEEVVAPFTVTVICSHPGTLASVFSEQAKLHVIYRGDDVGVIDDEMAAAIVGAVENRSSLVWVADGRFEVAAARFD
jgi:hypothetical protein